MNMTWDLSDLYSDFDSQEFLSDVETLAMTMGEYRSMVVSSSDKKVGANFKTQTSQIIKTSF